MAKPDPHECETSHHFRGRILRAAAADSIYSIGDAFDLGAGEYSTERVPPVCWIALGAGNVLPAVCDAAGIFHRFDLPPTTSSVKRTRGGDSGVVD